MKIRQRVIPTAVALIVLLMLIPAAYAAQAYSYSAEAQVLNDLGLYNGVSETSFDPDLGSALNRETGVVMLLRIFGLEAEAEAMADADVDAALARFSDADEISGWARKQVAYAVENGLVQGMTPGSFGAKLALNGKMYCTLILRQLGQEADYNNAPAQLAEVGGLDPVQAAMYTQKELVKDDLVGISYGALMAPYNDGSSVIAELVELGVVDESAASGAGFTIIDSQPADTPAGSSSGGSSGSSLEDLPILKHPAVIGDFSVIIEFSTAMDQETLENKENYLYSTDGVTYTPLSEDSNSNISAENDTTVILMIPGAESGDMIRMRNLKIAGGDTCRTTTEMILPPIPEADPAGGLYNQTQYVMLDAVSGTVYYTLDGTTPDNTDTDTLFGSTIIVGDEEDLDGKSWTLKAVSYDEAGNRSEVMTEEYRFDTAPPVVTAVYATPGDYCVGENLSLTIYSDAGGYQVAATVNSVAIDEADITDYDNGLYTMTYEVSEGNYDCADIADLAGNSLFYLTDAAGNMMSYYNVSLKNGSLTIDANSPEITGVSIAPGSYSAGDTVVVTVYADDTGYQAGTITVNGAFVDEGSFTDNGDNSYSMTYTVGAQDPSRSSAAEVPVMVTLADAAHNTASFEGEPTSEGAVTIYPVSGIYRVYIPAGNYGPGETVTATVYADAAGYSQYSLHLINTTGSGFTDNGDGTYTFGVTVMTFHDTYASIDAIPIDVQLYIIEEGMDSLIQFSGQAETDPGGEVTINVG